MSNAPGGPGWWRASDGNWYPPEAMPGPPVAAQHRPPQPATWPPLAPQSQQPAWGQLMRSAPPQPKQRRGLRVAAGVILGLAVVVGVLAAVAPDPESELGGGPDANGQTVGAADLAAPWPLTIDPVVVTCYANAPSGIAVVVGGEDTVYALNASAVAFNESQALGWRPVTEVQVPGADLAPLVAAGEALCR